MSFERDKNSNKMPQRPDKLIRANRATTSILHWQAGVAGQWPRLSGWWVAVANWSEHSRLPCLCREEPFWDEPRQAFSDIVPWRFGLGYSRSSLLDGNVNIELKSTFTHLPACQGENPSVARSANDNDPGLYGVVL